MQPLDPSQELLLGAAREIARKLSDALDAFPALPIELSRDEAIMALALIEAAIPQLAREIGAVGKTVPPE